MKKIFKRVLSVSIISFFIATLAFNYFSNRVVEELEAINKLHYENSYLSDAAIICMQLYIANPSFQNKATCVKIEHAINQNIKTMNNYTMATMYLEYVNKP